MQKVINTFVIIVTILSSLFGALLLSHSYSYNEPQFHNDSDSEDLEFPEGFLWGSATASYQIEGGNFNSNWWRFEQNGGIETGESAEITTDHYNRYEEDIELMNQLNLNSYRFSIEWSRINPEEGVFDEKEVEHYRNLVSRLRENDIEPLIVLWHFSYPQWFEDKGAFEKEENIKYYEDYVRYVVSNFPEIDKWITMNEVGAYLSCGYAVGKWPPGESRFTKIPAVFSRLIKSHKSAYKIIHELNPNAQVGIDHYTANMKPSNKWSPIDNLMAYSLNYLQTHMIMDLLQEHLDFIGMHYYYGNDVGIAQAFNLLDTDIKDFEKENLLIRYEPRSIYEILMKLKRYSLPIYITEFGTPDGVSVSREQFISDHIRELYYAIADGADVRGLFYWSLLDNFEWSEGYNPKFGLVRVDPETQERTIKDSAFGYSGIAKCNCIGNLDSRQTCPELIEELKH